MSKNHNVTVVTVTYNSMKVLPKLLASIKERVPVIIVDNGSKDIDEVCLLANKKNIRLIKNDTNIGFGAACNIGASKAKTKFILFLNPDAIITTNTLKALIYSSKKYSNCSAMNPRIIGKNNKPFFKRRSHLLPRIKWMKRGWPKNDIQVSVLSGSALFVRLKYFVRIGGFDENIFLFHEDDDISLRLQKAYGPLMFIYDAVVIHDSGNSSLKSNEITALKAWHMGQSKIYTIKKHKIPMGSAKAIAYALFKLFSPECVLSKRKRIKNYNYIRGLLNLDLTINT